MTRLHISTAESLQFQTNYDFYSTIAGMKLLMNLGSLPTWIVLAIVIFIGALFFFIDLFLQLIGSVLILWIILVAWRAFFHFFFPDAKDLD